MPPASGGSAAASGFTVPQRPYWSYDAPHALVIKKSILDSLQGISIGVNGMSASYDVKVTVGIGAFGFTVGSVLRPACECRRWRAGRRQGAQIVCNSATVAIYAKYGVGFTIPARWREPINFFLEKLASQPIKNARRYREEQPNTYSKTAYDPNTHICTGK